LKRLPLAPRPIKGELLSSWMARVSAVNGLTISELIEYADGTSNRAKIMQFDCDTSRSLIAGLAQACCISQDSLAEIDLCAQLPNAPAWLFLPVAHNVLTGHKRSTIAIPSCPACLGDHERKATSPYWRVEWALALVTLCPEHLDFLSKYCHHCLLGLLSVVAHPQHGRLVVRCTSCFQPAASRPVADPTIASPRTQLVASLGQTLVCACRAVAPDPMWLGPIDPAMFLCVVDDLIWFFMDGDLDGGYPLIDRCAPATDYEMSTIRRTLWQRPLNLLSVRQREIVVAAVAIALLGSRITDLFDPHSRLPVPVSKLDTYPFSSVMLSSRCDLRTRVEIAERIGRWPAPLKERALRHLPLGISTAPRRPDSQRA
jgi:hypothetical protein